MIRRTPLKRTPRKAYTGIEFEERFWSKVDVSGDCWEWTANIGIGGRYGAFKIDNKNRPAHRIAYELVVGPIPDGLELDHLCRNTKCVRPDHLEPVTHLENMRRSIGALRKNCRKHDIPLVIRPWGRICTECRKESNRQYRIRQGGSGDPTAPSRSWQSLTPEQRSEKSKRAWRKRKAHNDPVLQPVRNYVLARDARCIGVVVGMTGPCEGRAEIDHVMNAGKGKRGPSIKTNLVSLCSRHHLEKTSHASRWRPRLMDYLSRVEGAADDAA